MGSPGREIARAVPMSAIRPVPSRGADAPDRLQQLLDGRYVDPESGAAVKIATRSLVIADSIAGDEAALVDGLGFGRKLAVISDPSTAEVLGARVEAALRGTYEVQSLMLPADPHPDDATVAKVRSAAGQADAFIAVGSGTINDLAKYASALEGKPYAVFATAPSMNGFVSLTASITVGGHKSTLPAQPPVGAFFDLGVLAAAPRRMIRAGLGDSICRTTAQADWLLSHLLLGTAYRELPFDLLSADEPLLLMQAEALLRGDLGAMRTLTRTLLLSGFGTAIVGSSAPASQAEHLVSHYIDMLAQPASTALHGEQIAVTTLSIARLQHAMLAKARMQLAPDRSSDDEIAARFGKELAGSVLEEFAHKRLNQPKADALNDKLARDWDGIRERVAAVLLPLATIDAALRAAGAPRAPADIGTDRSFYEQALLHAREIRNRFTVLDLAAANGRLAPMLASL
jgi:glycerol-1-phosphate dehydrogenase [NAD(P)+]